MMLYSKETGGFYNDAIHKVIPEDAVEISEAQYQKLLADQSSGLQITADSNGKPEATEQAGPTRDDQIRVASLQVTKLLDAGVQTKDYLDLTTACSYATSTVDLWSTEALACAAWRDNVWQWFYKVVDSGSDIPTMAEMTKAMPPMQWPSDA